MYHETILVGRAYRLKNSEISGFLWADDGRGETARKRRAPPREYPGGAQRMVELAYMPAPFCRWCLRPMGTLPLVPPPAPAPVPAAGIPPGTAAFCCAVLNVTAAATPLPSVVTLAGSVRPKVWNPGWRTRPPAGHRGRWPGYCRPQGQERRQSPWPRQVAA